MKRQFLWAGVLCAMYLVTGFYIVRGNEYALVRRFGRVRLPASVSGLHYDLPWPFTQIDRVNVNQVRTLSLGIAAGEAIDGAGFLREVNLDRQGEFLTGDKNILNLQVQVQFRVADPYQFLFASESPEIGLSLLAESLVTDAIARSGVDYVHPLGLNELREFLTDGAQQSAREQPWGIEVEDMTIAGVLPPIEVKAAFLDVSNARAERDRLIHLEQSRAEKLRSAARARAQQTRDRAEAYRNTRVESARGSADRFEKIIAQFAREAETGKQTRDDVRRLTMRRMFTATLEEILPKLAGKVLLDTGKPVDLTIFPGEQKSRTPGTSEK